jgi:flagellar basal body-associated protein FliL
MEKPKAIQNEVKEQKDKAPKQKWSLKKKILAILSAIVVFIIAIVAIANMATSAPLQVSDNLLTDIRSLNTSAGYNLLSSGAKATITSADFSSVVDRIGPILTGAPELQSKEVSAETGSDSTAKVVYTIKGSDGLTYTMTVNLVDENGEWKVLNFDNTANKN